MVRWLRISLPVRCTQVPTLVPRKTPHALEQLSPSTTTTEAQELYAFTQKQEKPPQGEVHALQQRAAPTCHNWRKPT